MRTINNALPVLPGSHFFFYKTEFSKKMAPKDNMRSALLTHTFVHSNTCPQIFSLLHEPTCTHTPAHRHAHPFIINILVHMHTYMKEIHLDILHQHSWTQRNQSLKKERRKMVDNPPSERYRKLPQPPRHRVGWLPSISRREKFGVVKILYHFSHNKNVLGMDCSWQSQNSIHVLNLPHGTVQLTVVTMENAMLGMVHHYQRDGWGGRVLVEVLWFTQKGFVVRVWTHGYRGTEGPRSPRISQLVSN